MNTLRRAAATLAGVLTAATSLTACDTNLSNLTATSHGVITNYAGDNTTPAQARTELATLKVASTYAPGYVRSAFGPAWQDVNHNGCDTRNDILNRDLTNKTWKQRTHNCVVMSGTLHDPYANGKVITFTEAHPTQVQIDHVVPLGAAWGAGADTWTAAKRLQFANDPLNLLAVDGPNNKAKSDKDAAKWLPPNLDFQCAYVTRQIDVKAKYQLAVSAKEKADVTTVLTTRCS